ncbi:MAG: flagellar biosynthesis protein FlhA [Acidimicrobiales bacterium]
MIPTKAHQSRIGLIGVPLGVVMIIALFIIPLPTIVLDLLISANMVAAIVVLVVALQVRRPIEFSAFPTLLLVATLFRLALNISVTRLVLLKAYAGTVIEAFGHFVVGGSLVVGLVVFLIILVIQFVVVTNGAGRVAEVAARFTLDAMPGKQMAIDADLNAGLIDTAEARRRREETAAEADFYGAMDGASRFVKGDAIAALVIVAVNLIGGFVVGVVQHHMPVAQAVKTYSLLSVGDGLVSQIPALLMSVSTGIVVTRSGDQANDFGSDLIGQIRTHARAVIVGGAVLVALGLVPGLPKLPFIVVGLGAIGGGWTVSGHRNRPAEAELPQTADPGEINLESMAGELRVEALEVRVARDYVGLLDPAQGGELTAKVRNFRRYVSTELGFVVPTVVLRDDVSLDNGGYQILVHGVAVASGTTPPSAMLAIGTGIEGIEGDDARDPVFGLEAKLIAPSSRARAIMAGATVLDRASVVVTHLGEVVRSHAAELLSLQQVSRLMDSARHTDPAVLDELAAAGVSAGEVLGVCRGLLTEQVTIRDLVRILEAVGSRARVSKDPDGLLEAARVALGPAICAQWAADGHLAVVTLSPGTEAELVGSLRQGDGVGVFTAPPETLRQVVEQAETITREVENAGRRACLVCSAQIRPALRRLVSLRVPTLKVLSVAELAGSAIVDHVGVVDAQVEPQPA